MVGYSPRGDSLVMNVSQMIHSVSRANPHGVALSSGDSQLSFGSLNRAANQLAGHLRALGVTSGSVVPILLERSFEQITAALAVMRAGAAYLPMDTAWPDQRIRAILKDSEAEIFIAPYDLAGRLESGLRSVCTTRDSAAIEAATPVSDDLATQLASDSLAYLIYTSGSTGTPKGVEITHANLRNLIQWHLAAYSVTSEDRASHIAGLGFDAAVWEIWPYLAAGACVQLPGPMDELIRSSPAHLLRWLHDGHITHCFVPTALAEPLIQSEWPETTLLRFLLTGGDALRKKPLGSLPFTVVNNYGPTECTVVSTFGVVTADSPTPPPIGCAIRGASAYVLNEHREPVAPGEIGELYVGGASVGRGYRNLPDQTAAAFLQDPFSSEPGARMYRTGDMVAQLPNGQLAFHGRRDTQEKIRGQRMELDEINAVLSQCRGVLFSSVGTCKDNSGEKQLVAYVLPDEFAVPSSRALQEHLSKYLSSAMVPAIFVRLKVMPLNSSGKLDLSLLPAPNEQNALGDAEDQGSRQPATELEEAVLATVHGLLGSTSCGLDDDFFLSGGHSLLGAQLVTRVRTTYGVELTLRDLFEAPTAALLAQKVEELILAQIERMSDAEAEAAL
jgi:amino acid adenylation domain-containing protein